MDVLISHLPLENIKTDLHTGVAVASIKILNLVKDCKFSKKTKVNLTTSVDLACSPFEEVQFKQAYRSGISIKLKQSSYFLMSAV